MEKADWDDWWPRWVLSGWMFLLVPAHPGCPGQIPQSRKTVVCVCVSLGVTPDQARSYRREIWSMLLQAAIPVTQPTVSIVDTGKQLMPTTENHLLDHILSKTTYRLLIKRMLHPLVLSTANIGWLTLAINRCSENALFGCHSSIL